MVLPRADHFPDAYDGAEAGVRLLLDQVCRHMQIDPARVDLALYSETANGVHAESGTTGLYDEQQGKITVWLEESHLNDPASVAATFAHELGHLHLLGDKRVAPDVDDMEPLTDLLTVLLGLGVITANSTIRDRSHRIGTLESWSISGQGYLNSQVYGYALALFAWVRGEPKPPWARYLCLDARTSLRKGLKYVIKTGDSTFTRDGDLRPDWLTPCPSNLCQVADPTADPEDVPGEDCVEPGADEDSLTADDYFTEAVMFAREGDARRAIEHFTEAIRLCPSDAEFFQQRSLAYFGLGMYDKAFADAAESVRLAPDDIESYRVRGYASFGITDYARAVRDFGRVIDAERWDSGAENRRWETFYWRGRSLAARGSLAEALADVEKAAALSPLSAAIYIERSRLHQQLGNHDKAAQDRREAFGLDPTLAEAEFGDGETEP